ncbi:TspO/MBR family protein [Salinisphaera sp.]|uniref:TspO/MBR family protein n=1 Tax=Salinisphaera sp. TaxID=1914330 RepID=UPI002D782E9C|nr:TspO/MBR family protein [Salinisphaera sp.]HET7315178.1 TspO/MBR family protein [Salinisphaera sp.]
MAADDTYPNFNPALAAAACGILVALTSLTGALAPPGDWYAALNRPPGTPPDVAFPIAWTLLYIAMAVAAWRVWRARGPGREVALFVLQLALNALWMPVAFGAHALGWALLVIVVLWLAVAATTAAFWRADRLAGLLFAIYLAWVSYAVYLNAGLFWLN